MPNRPTALCLLSSMLMLLANTSASARDASAAHFYFYRPAAGQIDAFEQGYRRHLEWHRRHHCYLACLQVHAADAARPRSHVARSKRLLELRVGRQVFRREFASDAEVGGLLVCIDRHVGARSHIGGDGPAHVFIGRSGGHRTPRAVGEQSLEIDRDDLHRTTWPIRSATAAGRRRCRGRAGGRVR